MKRKIVLASQSSRRKRLLKQIGISEFEIRESDYKEDMLAHKEPGDLVQILALEKARDVARHYKNTIVIAADSVISFQGRIIGKPKDENEARELLKQLSGNTNKAYSGLAIIDTKSGKEITDFGWAKVVFRKFTDEEVDSYIATKEPLEMAGAYGLMNKGAVLMKEIKGDFYSIIGFPLTKLYLHLKKMGVDIW
ncbi:MAG TPA: septum formation protein Maf [Candidatus Moranbacteria bacterium]|nr:septum formation protein Maf [Candidatus Moranbacteria bacterium]